MTGVSYGLLIRLRACWYFCDFSRLREQFKVEVVKPKSLATIRLWHHVTVGGEEDSTDDLHLTDEVLTVPCAPVAPVESAPGSGQERSQKRKPERKGSVGPSGAVKAMYCSFKNPERIDCVL